MRPFAIALICASVASTAAIAPAAERCGFGLDVLVGGVPRPEYAGRDTVYVEAERGREYVLRITNPLPVRIAVALAVDGLNTIDARHGDAGKAAKWVLPPYGSIAISGWQVSGSEARAFVFTGERSSYGAWLGETANLGVIEAVFYREHVRPIPVVVREGVMDQDRRGSQTMSPHEETQVPEAGNAPKSKLSSAAPLSDDYAATGIGDRRDNRVEWVSLELERDAAAVVRLRYEFRPQLERLGLLPPLPLPAPLERREHAAGFSGRYCPEPPAR
jgi:hypothetical protein